MERTPMPARLATRPFARLRAGRARAARGRAGDASSAPPADVVDAEVGRPGLGDLSRLTATLRRHGHDVRLSDRSHPGEVPDVVVRAGRRVLEDVVAVLVRSAASDQRVSVRVRTEDDHLLIAVQTLPAGQRPKPVVPAPRDEDVIRRQVASAGGRATVRTTHGGNWIAMARLPLHP